MVIFLRTGRTVRIAIGKMRKECGKREAKGKGERVEEEGVRGVVGKII